MTDWTGADTGWIIEKLYQYEHPKLVSEFEAVMKPMEGQGWYWISTKWLRGAYTPTGFPSRNYHASTF